MTRVANGIRRIVQSGAPGSQNKFNGALQFFRLAKNVAQELRHKMITRTEYFYFAGVITMLRKATCPFSLPCR